MANPIFGLILFMNVFQHTAAGSSVYLNKVCDIVFFVFFLQILSNGQELDR